MPSEQQIDGSIGNFLAAAFKASSTPEAMQRRDSKAARPRTITASCGP
jgi:hypothetical protein